MRINLKTLLAFAAVALIGAAAMAAVPDKSYVSNMYGGAIYDGSPRLELTAALLQAGGGQGDYSLHTAFVTMLGQKAADTEMDKLTRQYGAQNVAGWIDGSNWMMVHGLASFKSKGMNLPEVPTDLNGVKLAAALVNAGIAPDDAAYWSGRMYDHLFSHDINAGVVKDMDRKASQYYAKNMYAINNQAMYDVAQSLDTHDVELALLH
jgi:hypothetical protein